MFLPSLKTPLLTQAEEQQKLTEFGKYLLYFTNQFSLPTLANYSDRNPDTDQAAYKTIYLRFYIPFLSWCVRDKGVCWIGRNQFEYMWELNWGKIFDFSQNSSVSICPMLMHSKIIELRRTSRFRWYALCHVPRIVTSLTQYDVTQIFGVSFLKFTFPIIKKQFLDKVTFFQFSRMSC